MSGHSGDHLRRDYRFPAKVPAAVHLEGRSIDCVAENLSRTGVLLIGRFPTPTGEQLDLTLKTPTGGLEVELAGRVARIDHDPTRHETLLAVEFVEMDTARHDALEAFLARLLESHPSGSLESVRPGAAPHEVKKVLESIPLPQRIAMAQRVELKQREFLRQDQHPAVLDSLVHHPGLTLIEARAIAASAYLQAGTIDLLASDPRFKGDEELRMVLATHARVSMITAEKLTADFNSPQIKKLLARPGLNQLLREKLFRKMVRG